MANRYEAHMASGEVVAFTSSSEDLEAAIRRDSRYYITLDDNHKVVSAINLHNVEVLNRKD